MVKPKANEPLTTYKRDFQDPKNMTSKKQDKERKFENNHERNCQNRPNTVAAVKKTDDKKAAMTKCASFSTPTCQFQLCAQKLQQDNCGIQHGSNELQHFNHGHNQGNCQQGHQKALPSTKSRAGENRLVINANCVHLNVMMPNQVSLNVSGKKPQAKGAKNAVVNCQPFDIGHQIQSQLAKFDSFSKPAQKNESKKNCQEGKLFDPPWGYKGHQPRPATFMEEVLYTS